MGEEQLFSALAGSAGLGASASEHDGSQLSALAAAGARGCVDAEAACKRSRYKSAGTQPRWWQTTTRGASPPVAAASSERASASSACTAAAPPCASARPTPPAATTGGRSDGDGETSLVDVVGSALVLCSLAPKLPAASAPSGSAWPCAEPVVVPPAAATVGALEESSLPPRSPSQRAVAEARPCGSTDKGEGSARGGSQAAWASL
mmetsp:Transcript_28672/g.67188  ORF Transcript_28672/g.67188 Transcript_28672/m.67188 type:complete len:206 (-) Transcript_28672:818-1435(-)